MNDNVVFANQTGLAHIYLISEQLLTISVYFTSLFLYYFNTQTYDMKIWRAEWILENR